MPVMDRLGKLAGEIGKGNSENIVARGKRGMQALLY
jgi:hypothetical protein